MTNTLTPPAPGARELVPTIMYAGEGQGTPPLSIAEQVHAANALESPQATELAMHDITIATIADNNPHDLQAWLNDKGTSADRVRGHDRTRELPPDLGALNAVKDRVEDFTGGGFKEVPEYKEAIPLRKRITSQLGNALLNGAHVLGLSTGRHSTRTDMWQAISTAQRIRAKQLAAQQ